MPQPSPGTDRTLHNCPLCGGPTTLPGPCERCTERADQRHRERQHHTRTHFLTHLWNQRRPIFWTMLFLTTWLGWSTLHFQGRLLHYFWHTPPAITSTLLATLTLTSTALLVTHTTWTAHLQRHPHASHLWLTLNLSVLALNFFLGLLGVTFLLFLAERQLPVAYRLTWPAPMWRWTQLTLLTLPVLLAVLWFGSLSPA